MIERRICRSRRNMLRAAMGGISTALLLRSRARASEKMTKARAEYQDTPNGIYSCATCTLFEAPNSCKVVEGEVSKEGWCKAFALAD
jgi:High potential iron-sulfur protein